MIGIKKLFTPVKSMDGDQAKSFIAEHEEGTYTILDVRQPSEYEEAHIPGATLIPLPNLHDSLNELDPEKPTIAYCAIGGRSRVAAQLLSGLGFKKIYNLKGGIKAWQGVKAEGPRELNLDLIRGDEAPAEIVLLAYGMETGLQTFYETMNQRSKDQELTTLFKKLAEVEKSHKKMLFGLHTEVASSEKDLKTFEADADQMIMEGGFSMSEFMEKNVSFLHDVKDVIDLAMMLETQSLDLYLRFADKSTNAQTKGVLFKIAEEEKAHLASLGNLLEQKS
jgi:rhodanese-related sulfurtransferase/rubrerythrin